MTPVVARSLFPSTDPSHWFRDDDGRELLRRLLLEQVTDGGTAAGEVLRLWHGFGPEEQQRIARHWLTEEGALSETTISFEFVNKVGKLLGRWALSRDARESPTWAMQWVQAYLETPPKTGLLARDAGYQQWISGIVFGAKESFCEMELSRSVAGDFAELMTLCWEHVQRLEASREASTGFQKFLPTGRARRRLSRRGSPGPSSASGHRQSRSPRITPGQPTSPVRGLRPAGAAGCPPRRAPPPWRAR